MSETTEQLIGQLEDAYGELTSAVRRQWNGEPTLRLSIPANLNRDTDLVIGAALRAAIQYLTERSEGGGERE